MRAFIVRPFHTQIGIDFDRVDKELIGPVLKEFGIEGGTTEEIAWAGNIRTDVFERLLVADLVIADISIHNANVYYELGIRHALRDRTTILMRAAAHPVPFDLQTDRYFEYDAGDPAQARPQLSEAIRQSTMKDRPSSPDSPVYLLLPKLKPQDPSTFDVVPQAFSEAVREATTAQDRPRLALMSEEIEPLGWVLSGRRVIGRAQFQLRAWSDARETWEWVREERPDDFEANLALGTVLQNLGELEASSIAVSRVLQRADVPDATRAEALALRASNSKTKWIAEWRAAPESDRGATALGSSLLYDAARDYDDGFYADQNHFYPGINALSLTTLILRLAELNEDAWENRFESADEAALELRRIKDRRQVLAASVQRSLDAQERRLERTGARDPWLAMTWADYRLLTSDKPPFVKAAYDKARAGLAGTFSLASSARQLRMYLQLGTLADNARAGLQALGASEDDISVAPTKSRVIVFSGHRIDAPDRATPRFPNDRAEQARSMIRDAIDHERTLAGDAQVEGFAGGASGGDILFHESCAELGIPTTLLLAMPEEGFIANSVADGGADWVERFRRLRDRVPTRILQTSEDLPDWLASRRDYSVWQRNNLWVLHTGFSRDNADVTLIVLWNGQGGDGPGGTEDMVNIARRLGVKVVRLDSNELLAPASADPTHGRT
jgi:hypothetical protein